MERQKLETGEGLLSCQELGEARWTVMQPSFSLPFPTHTPGETDFKFLVHRRMREYICVAGTVKFVVNKKSGVRNC